MYKDRLGGVVVSRTFVQSAAGPWLDPLSSQVEDRKIDTCGFPG